jgi:Outer membrane protein beta-barrel domain
MFQKRRQIVFIIFMCTALLANVLQAQSRFKGGIVAGFNAAQIDGDASAGYNKVGLNAGARVLIELTGRYQISTEILFSQRGSRTTEKESAVNRTCTLNYLEVPILFNIRDWLKKSDDEQEYYKVAFSAGLVYGRLFKASASPNFFHAPVLDKFATNDVSFAAGLNYFINPHWGLSCRVAKSFNKLFNPLKYTNDPLVGGFLPLRGHYLTFQTAWIF